MSLSELSVCLLLLLAFLYLWKLQQKHQQAIIAVKHYCQKEGLQLLDDTISCLGVCRWHYRQRKVWALRYQFEFATDGSERYKGHAYFYRQSLHQVTLDAHRMP